MKVKIKIRISTLLTVVILVLKDTVFFVKFLNYFKSCLGFILLKSKAFNQI